MFDNLLNYIMIIVVMAMSRDIVSYVTCRFYVLCEIPITIKLNKFICFSYIDIIIIVYGSMVINIVTISCILVYIYVYYLRYALNVLLPDLLYKLFSTLAT